MEQYQHGRGRLAAGIFLSLAANLFPGGAQSVIMPGVADQLDGWAYYGLVFTVSTLATAVFTPMAGKLGESWGQKRLILCGTVLILLANLALPICPSMGLFVLLRFLAGLGGALVTAPGLTLIGRVYPKEERVRWMGYYGMLSSACNGFGPLLGGVCAGLFGWQLVYFSAVPLALAGLVLLLRGPAPECRPSQRAAAFDWPGLALLAGGMGSMTALCQGAGSAFPWRSIPTLCLSILLGGTWTGFVLVERRQGTAALLPVSLFRSSIFSSAFGATFLTTLSAISVFTYLALYLQSVAGYSAALSGVPVTAEFLTAMAFSPLLGRIMARTGRYRAASAGTAVIMAGVSLFYSFMGPNVSFGVVLSVQICYGLAGGAVTSVYLMAVQAQMPGDLLAPATAGVQLGQTVGGTVGAAVFGALAGSGPHGTSLPFVFQAAAVLALLAVPASLRLSAGKARSAEQRN